MDRKIKKTNPIYRYLLYGAAAVALITGLMWLVLGSQTHSGNDQDDDSSFRTGY